MLQEFPTSPSRAESQRDEVSKLPFKKGCTFLKVGDTTKVAWNLSTVEPTKARQRPVPIQASPGGFGDAEFFVSPLLFPQNTASLPLWTQTGEEWSQVF